MPPLQRYRGSHYRCSLMRASSSRRDERSSSIASRPPLVRRLYPSYLSARRLPGKLPLHYSHSTGQTRRSKNHQANQMVFRSFRCARYCGQDGAGKRLGPGLPDILGTLPSENGAAGTSGAFAGGASGVQSYLGPGGTDSIAYQLSFKASRSSGIYGASTTVMPASVESPVALYLGRFAEV